METYILSRSYRQNRNFGHNFSGGRAPTSTEPRRKILDYLQKDSPYRVRSRSFSSANGDGDVNSPKAGILEKFVSKEGDTIMPGTKVAIISQFASTDTRVAPSEEKSGKDAPQPTAPVKKEEDKPKAKVEVAIKENA